jgi:alkylhydroperoxidase family enzyme
MARIRPPEDGSLLPDDQQAESAFATMGSLFRIMAHRPELARQCRQLLQTLMRSGSVEPQLKELLAIRVSQVNYCHY